MYEQLTPVSKTRFAGKRLKPITSLKFAETQHLVRIVVPEFPRVSQDCGVVFLKDPQGQTIPFALAGVQQGKSLMVDQGGRWRAPYVPAIVRRYPFILINTGSETQLAVAIDENCGLISDNEGDRLFDDGGNPTGPLKNVMDLLGQLQVADRDTIEYCAALVKHDMLRPMRYDGAARSGRRFNIGGMMAVDEQRFNALPDDVYLDWRRRGWIAATYAHLMSLARIPRLVELADQVMGPAPVAGNA